MRILFFVLLFFLKAWSVEYGILKYDQQVKDPLIVDQYPGAITIEYCIECSKDYLQASLKEQRYDILPLIERLSLSSNTSKELESVSSNATSLQPIWVVDLSKTYMSEDDFIQFMTVLKPYFANLQILILNSVSLFQNSTWEHLFPYLQFENFKYLDVCGTHCAIRNIKPILEIINNRFPECWDSMSQKIIFSQKSYYKKLEREMVWVQQCVEQRILSANWFSQHSLYYGETEKEMQNKIKNAKPMHFLSGDSDYDQEYEECDDTLSIDFSS